MPRTERLYYNDSHLIEFEASVVDTSDRVSGWSAVTLDRTAFYPTGGGQPSDTGTLNGTRVVECIDDGDNGVLHVMQGRPPEIGSTVRGRIDWSRRLDHIQQHTGQHILSQAFITLFNAPTKSFRMLEQSCEIDVELANPADDLIERAVQLANNVIWEDRKITIKTVSAEAAAQLPLRKDSARTGELRLIEIDGFDLTPCGGTHAYRTGEVGMIAVRSWERAKGLTRIVFVAGTRALADYQAANKTAQAVASLYSAARDDAAKLTKRVLDENKELHRRVRVLEEIAARVEAEELVQQAGIVGILDASVRDSEGVTDSSRGSSAQRDTPGIAGYSVPDPKGVADVHGAGRQVDPARLRLVTKVFDNRDAESLKHLAQALISHPMTIALLGSREKDAARLVFARSADAPGDMNALMKAACVLLDGRGGGKPDLAQGGGHNVEKLQAAIDNACECFSQRMSEQEIRLRGPDPKRANDPIKATK
ncbi:MAG TPA: DHHA1 domain-containing protein [Pyrinomonadaceae bacterium]|nr:DHHA1 domain-containing protein [Pyrinomonadaceae bacterium]